MGIKKAVELCLLENPKVKITIKINLYGFNLTFLLLLPKFQ